MTHVVTESCIRCKYTDCVDVCPVDCFREGPNLLVIDPDECIDCAVCIPECPVNAIMPRKTCRPTSSSSSSSTPSWPRSWPQHHQAQGAAAGRRRMERHDRKLGELVR